MYVALALFGALLTFVGAPGLNRKPQTMHFPEAGRRSVCRLEPLDCGRPGEVYARTAVGFYDVVPSPYHGWKEFQAGVQKEFWITPRDQATAGKIRE